MKFNWGTAIILFFVLFLSLCIASIVFALRQNQDLVEDDYYEKGAGYTKQMEINKRSLAYQDSIIMMATDSSVIFSISKYMAIKQDNIQMYFFRPSDKKADFRTTLSTGQSREVSKTNLVSGRYLVKFSWVSDHNEYMLEKEIIIK